jgi:hypothetical protein
MKDNALYNWMFHYNHHTGFWNAFHREDHTAYWNGTLHEHNIYQHSDITELLKILNTFQCI